MPQRQRLRVGLAGAAFATAFFGADFFAAGFGAEAGAFVFLRARNFSIDSVLSTSALVSPARRAVNTPYRM